MLVCASIQQWQGSALLCCRHHARAPRPPLLRAPMRSPVLQWRGLKAGVLRLQPTLLAAQPSRFLRPQAEYTSSDDSAADVEAEGFHLGLVYVEETGSEPSREENVADLSCRPSPDADSVTEPSSSSSKDPKNGHAHAHNNSHCNSDLGEERTRLGEGLTSVVDESALHSSAALKNGHALVGSESSAAAECDGDDDDANGAADGEEIPSQGTELTSEGEPAVTQDSLGDQLMREADAVQNLLKSLAAADNAVQQKACGEPRTPDCVNGHAVEFDAVRQAPVPFEDLDYYVPVSGHRVVGVVVSGNHAKLDVDIGAAKLGHLHVKEFLPIDKFRMAAYQWQIPEDAADGGVFAPPSCGHPHVVYDDEVLSYDEPAPLSIDVGTVLDLEVMGETLSGNALLSVRRSARHVAWERVRQIKQQNEPIEVEVVEWNEAGIISRIEGVRAFLPLVEFVKHPNKEAGETLKDYVGRKLWVLISIAEEVRGNLVISEREAWARKNLSPGTLHDGTVVQIFNFGARVQVNGTDVSGLIHISNIARALIHRVSDVFTVGEQIKMIVVDSPVPNRVAFSTADLESEKGLMLRDKQRVFREAEETAKAFREANQNWIRSHGDDAEELRMRPQKPIANLEWLDFGGNTASLF